MNHHHQVATWIQTGKNLRPGDGLLFVVGHRNGSRGAPPTSYARASRNSDAFEQSRDCVTR